MSALDEPHDREVRPPERNSQTEVQISHNSEQTLLAVELPHGSVCAVVDVGRIPLEREQEFASELETLVETLVSDAGGGADAG